MAEKRPPMVDNWTTQSLKKRVKIKPICLDGWLWAVRSFILVGRNSWADFETGRCGRSRGRGTISVFKSSD